MSVYLHGMSLRNYRGIGREVQKVGPFKSCNFFIGANNSGKSSFLNFIALHLRDAITSGANGSRLSLRPFEVHLNATDDQVEVGFPIRLDELIEKSIKLLHSDDWGTLSNILRELLFNLSDGEFVWIKKSATNLSERHFQVPGSKNISKIISHGQWNSLWRNMMRSNGGDIESHWIPQVTQRILGLIQLNFPQAKIIPAKRQIGKKGEVFGDFSGVGLIDKLAELQNPSPNKRELRLEFNKINNFLQDVIGDSSAIIEIPHDREEILVHKEQRVLPLSSLGTGIHEVVMIAAFCTLTQKSIVCIEEPEIHLHPLLQKKLINYIVEKTDNQYFIATHSASIIDHSGAAVFHVKQKNQETSVELAVDSIQRFAICYDLGYKASDFLQTNSIIWVEGPSDRIYLKHWIAALDPKLKEGIHFSIMYYGGRLLSHLSASDEEIEEFIAIRKLNRNMGIIIDSDKTYASCKINATKKRIISEFEKCGDPAWLTSGREIENYLTVENLNTAIESVYESFSAVESTEKFSHRLPFFKKGKDRILQSEVDKVKVARAVCKIPANLDVFDLREQVKNMVSMIQKANF